MNPSQIISEGLSVTADELAELRDVITNANKPVLDALGQVLSKLDAIQEDLTAHQKYTGEELSKLRKAVFGGPSAAE